MNRRDLRAVPVDDEMAVTIKKVGVIGSGQMGNGIAHVAALAGFDVVLNDLSDERLKSAMATINGHLSRQVAKKVVTEDARKQAGYLIDDKIEIRFVADPEVARHHRPEALAAFFELGYHTKHVETIFRRVFG